MKLTPKLLCLSILVLVPSLFAQKSQKANLILITLDTTRADVLGAFGAKHHKTPNLDQLAASGSLYLQAFAPAPLTLPSHASLMTGKTPLQHGIHSNGTAALAESQRTLAEVLSSEGYTTAAFVASQVLDRRFGLAQGFSFYADEINAAQVGESGYPERDADGIVEDALSWINKTQKQPYFIWLHFYDPHTPYGAPGSDKHGSPYDRYADEVSFMDQAIGKLLKNIPMGNTLIAAVADHGEMMMEHGEETHGVLLQQAVLHVPLIIKGPNVPKALIGESVGSLRLASTLLHLLGLAKQTSGFAEPLPGFPFSPKQKDIPIYSESHMPLSAYGWAPLEALTVGPYRLVVGPNPELVNFIEDPGEKRNLLQDQRQTARDLRDKLRALKEKAPKNPAELVQQDPQMAAALRSLGYASGPARPSNDGIDPKQGLVLMARFEEAKIMMAKGQFKQAKPVLEELSRRNPNNIPFLTRLAEVQLNLGNVEQALEGYHHAIQLNPELDFLHLNLGAALRKIGDLEAARASLELATHLNPRSAAAWLSLAEIANLKGDAETEHQILHHAMSHGVASAPLLTRLAQIEISLKKWGQADKALEAATLLEPSLTTAWLLWGELAEAQGDVGKALSRYSQARNFTPDDPAIYTRVGRLYLKAGDAKNATKYLQIAVDKAPNTVHGKEAQKLMDTLKSIPGN